MSNFDSITLPKLPNEPTHEVVSETMFIDVDKEQNIYKIVSSLKESGVVPTIPVGSRVIALESSLGYKLSWLKVLLQEDGNFTKTGYILQESVTTFFGDSGENNKTKTLIQPNVLPQYQPRLSAQKKDWRFQKANTVFVDEKRGIYAINYDAGVEVIPLNGLEEIIQTAFKNGLYIILSSLGKKYTLESVMELQNKYFCFAKAEAIDFDLRNCSTLRVLITLPMRYAESSEILRETEEATYSEEIISSGLSHNQVKTDPGAPRPSGSAEPPPEYEDLIFNSYEEFDTFFKYLYNFDKSATSTVLSAFSVGAIGAAAAAGSAVVAATATAVGLSAATFINSKSAVLNSCQTIFSSRNWSIEPSGVILDFNSIIAAMVDFKDKTNQLIYSNIPIAKIEQAVNGLAELKQYNTKNSNIVRSLNKLGFYSCDEVIKHFKTTYEGISWNGKLTLTVDKTSKKIINISFETNGEKIPLNRDFLKTLNDDSFTNKTSLNYIINCYQAIKQNDAEFFDVSDYLSTNPITAPFYDIKKINPNKKSPDQVLSDFITKNHYPQVTLLEAQPLDVGECTKNTIDLVEDIYKSKTREAREVWVNALKKRNKERKKYEGNFLSKAINGVWNNKTFNILMGKDAETEEMMKKSPREAIRTKIFPALQEIGVYEILAELIKCSTGNLTPEEFADIMSKYNIAKEYIEQLAFSTVCNPFLTNSLKTIKGIQLPRLEIYDPNKNLQQELEKYYIKALKDVLIASTRELIKSMMKNCISNPNKEQEPAGSEGVPDQIAEALQNPENGSEVSDLLDDIFGKAPPTPDTANKNSLPDLNTPDDPADKISQAVNLLDDFSCLLTTNELCRLLNGSSIPQETYETLIIIIRAKYPNLVLRNKLTTEEDLKNFFYTIGKNIDLNVCNVVNQQPDIVDCGCSDDVKQAAQKAILSSKGLDADLVDDIVKNLKDQEKTNIENTAKYINGGLSTAPNENPISFLGVPDALCKKDQDGVVIPPGVELSPSLKSFSGLTDTLFNSVYDSFDKEATEWSKTSYSISSSGPQMMYFDESTGKIAISAPKVDPAAEYTKDNAPTIGNTDTKKILYPSYLLNDILKDKTYTLYPEQGNDATGQNTSLNQSKPSVVPAYSVYIDGNKQQKLDINLISDALVQKINTANEKLKTFIGVLFSDLEAVLVFTSIESLTSFSFGEMNKFLRVMDSFLRDTPHTRENRENEKILSLLGKNADETAIFLNETGAPTYLSVMNFLRDKKTNFYQLAAKISSIIDSPSIGNLNEKQLISLYEDNIKTFEDVEKVYNAVFKSTVHYPNYNFTFTDNYNSSGSDIFTEDKLYDKYKIEITKNGSPLIVAENYQTYDETLKNYLESLEITQQNPDKQEVYEKYINKINKPKSNIGYKDVSSDLLNKNNSESRDNISYKEIAAFFAKKSLNSLINNTLMGEILDSPFMSKIKVENSKDIIKKRLNEDGETENYTETSPEIWKATTDYLSLVLKGRPTPEESACGIRPHYLDIDDIKNDAAKKKAGSMCIEEIVTENIRQNLPVDTEELESLEKNDTQNILAYSGHRLTLRVYLHDIILRSISTFGYYDPQILRDDQLFIDYVTSCVESEIKSVDSTYYNMLLTFISNLSYQKGNENKDDAKFKKLALKAFIKEELRVQVLPKLAKRIVDDTYDVYSAEKQSNDLLPDIQFNLKKYNSLTSLIDTLKISKNIKNEEDGVYIQLETYDSAEMLNLRSDIEDNVKTQIDYRAPRIKILEGKIEDYNDNSPEFMLLFDYLFPIKRYISCLFITNNLCTLTRKQVLNTFYGTKSKLRSITKIIYSNGQPITPNPNNPQDLMNADKSDSLRSFILKALLMTPIQIAKGFIELAEPTVAISSGVYKAGKLIDPKLSPGINPAIGVPTAIAATIGQFWFPALMPFALNVYNGIYYAGGLWMEDIIKDAIEESDNKKDDLANKLLETGSSANCEDLENHGDKLKFDDQKYVQTKERT